MTAPHYFIYDARCGLCMAFRDWLMERSKPGQFDSVSFDDPRLARILPGKSDAEIRESAHVVTPDGRVLSGHAAILLAITTRWWGRLIRPILSLPFLDPLVRVIYTWISQHRYRLSCQSRDGNPGAGFRAHGRDQG